MPTRALVIIASAFAAASLLITGPASAADHGTLTWEPHTFTASEGRSAEAELGTLTVRYDRADPDSDTIDLKFVRFPATTDNPGPPLVYLAGGPGGSGTGSARGPRFELFMKLRELGDVIAWDQRGTGLSEPRVRVEATFDVPFEGAVSHDWLSEQYAEVGRKAREQFERDGFDPAPLNSNASADDLEDLRIALGEESLRLWAISYGTHLALATAKRHPDSIESMVLAGVEPLDSTYKLPSQAGAPMRALSREIAAHPVFGPMIPDFTALVRDVLERAEREPFAVEIAHPETGDPVVCEIGRLELEYVTWGALFRRDRMSILPAAYLATSMGRTEMLAQVPASSRGSSGGGNAMSLAMDCASGVGDDRRARIERETPDSLFGRSMNFHGFSICPTIDVPDLGDDYRAPLVSDMPVLCLSGELDVRTPPANAERILEHLPNGQHVVITRAGHDNDLWVSSPKIAECMLAFFRGQALPHERIELPPLEFMVPEGFAGE